jgi:hypothetical protein
MGSTYCNDFIGHGIDRNRYILTYIRSGDVRDATQIIAANIVKIRLMRKSP